MPSNDDRAEAAPPAPALDAVEDALARRGLGLAVRRGVMRVGAPAGAVCPALVLPAAHPQVGDLTLLDDGDELTAYIGDLTHGHFTPADATPAAMQANTLEVVGWIEALVADRVLIWTALGAGGWRVADAPARVAPPSWLRRWYVWSGPLARR